MCHRDRPSALTGPPASVCSVCPPGPQRIILNPSVESVPTQVRSLFAADPTVARFTVPVEGTWLACHRGRRSWSPSARGTAGFRIVGRLKSRGRAEPSGPQPIGCLKFQGRSNCDNPITPSLSPGVHFRGTCKIRGWRGRGCFGIKQKQWKMFEKGPNSQ